MKNRLICLAVEKGLTKIVILLGDIIGGIDIIDDYGWTPFICACAHGNIEIMKYLYGKGARVDKIESMGKSGLHLAAQNGHIEAVEWLIEIGASRFLKNKTGQTPLDLAIANNRTEIVKTMERFRSVSGLKFK